MKLVKFALYLAILIALTKNGYSADPVWKTLSDPSNGDQDHAGRLADVKPATWRSKWYDVRSRLPPCVERETRVLYEGNQMYTEYKCKDFDVRCSGRTHNLRCKATYRYIADLEKAVVIGCKCPD